MLSPIFLCAVCLVTHCVWLFATPWTVARRTPLSMGILQTRVLEWVAMPSSRGSFQPGDQTQISCITGGFFTVWATREAPTNCAHCKCRILNSEDLRDSLVPVLHEWVNEWVKVAQSCPTLCNSMDYTVHEVLQARILEEIAFSFSRDTSWGYLNPRRSNSLRLHIAFQPWGSVFGLLV